MDSSDDRELESRLENLGPPRGTLAIILIYAAIFGLAWMSLFFFEFMPRGAPHP